MQAHLVFFRSYASTMRPPSDVCRHPWIFILIGSGVPGLGPVSSGLSGFGGFCAGCCPYEPQMNGIGVVAGFLVGVGVCGGVFGGAQSVVIFSP